MAIDTVSGAGEVAVLRTALDVIEAEITGGFATSARVRNRLLQGAIRGIATLPPQRQSSLLSNRVASMFKASAQEVGISFDEAQYENDAAFLKPYLLGVIVPPGNLPRERPEKRALEKALRSALKPVLGEPERGPYAWVHCRDFGRYRLSTVVDVSGPNYLAEVNHSLLLPLAGEPLTGLSYCALLGFPGWCCWDIAPVPVSQIADDVVNVCAAFVTKLQSHLERT